MMFVFKCRSNEIFDDYFIVSLETAYKDKTIPIYCFLVYCLVPRLICEGLTKSKSRENMVKKIRLKSIRTEQICGVIVFCMLME